MTDQVLPMRRPVLLTALALVSPAVFCSGCATTNVRTARHFDSNRPGGASVTVIPPDFRVVQNPYGDVRSVPALARLLKSEIRAYAEAFVDSGRYALSPLYGDDGSLGRTHILAARADSENRAARRLFKTLPDAMGGGAALQYEGDLSDLGALTGSDYFLLLSGLGQYSTKGTFARSLEQVATFGPTERETITLEAMLVDAGSSQVVWYNLVGEPQDPRDLESIHGMVRSLLTPLVGQTSVELDDVRQQRFDEELTRLQDHGPGGRMVLRGCSLAAPSGDGWRYDRTSDSVVFVKSKGTSDHSFALSAFSYSPGDTFQSPEQFLAHQEATFEEHTDPERFRVLTREIALDNAFGEFCVRYHFRAEDLAISRPGLGSPVVIDIHGYSLLHPDSPEVILKVEYSERCRPGESVPELVPVGDAFVRSLEFLRPDAP